MGVCLSVTLWATCWRGAVVGLVKGCRAPHHMPCHALRGYISAGNWEGVSHSFEGGCIEVGKSHPVGGRYIHASLVRKKGSARGLVLKGQIPSPQEWASLAFSGYPSVFWGQGKARN